MSENTVRALVDFSGKSKWMKGVDSNKGVEENLERTVKQVLVEDIVVYSNSKTSLGETKGYIHAHTWPFWYEDGWGNIRNEITIPRGTTVHYHAYLLTTQHAPKGQVHASLVVKSEYGLDMLEKGVIPGDSEQGMHEVPVVKWSLCTESR